MADMTARQSDRPGIGPYVKNLMETHEPAITAKDLQTALGISQSTASRKLSGDRQFDLTELMPLAALLGVPVDQILTAGLSSSAGAGLSHSNSHAVDNSHGAEGTTLRFSELQPA